MSCLDYDFQKCTILSLGLTAATLIIGLVLMQVGHGQTNNNNTETNADATRTYLIVMTEVCLPLFYKPYLVHQK